jgi:hypothetical protein
MDATCRSTNSSRTASANIVRSVAWMIRTEFAPYQPRYAQPGNDAPEPASGTRNRTEPRLGPICTRTAYE